MFELTLTHPDGSTFIVGGFNSEDDANQWIATSKSRGQWIDGTIPNIVNTSLPPTP